MAKAKAIAKIQRKDNGFQKFSSQFSNIANVKNRA